MGPSTLSSWVLLVARTLRERGVDADELLRRAKLNPAQLQDPNSRCPLAAVQRLWALAAEAAGDPCFGLEVGRAWHPTTFHALGYAALASGTLRHALGYLVRYSRTVSTGARVDLLDRGAETSIGITSRLQDYALQAGSLRHPVQAGLAALAALCRAVRGAPLAFERVAFTDADHACEQRLAAFFGCRVVFGAAENALVVRAAELDAPLPTGNPVLLRSAEQLLADYAGRLDTSHVAERLRSWLVRALPSGEVDEEAAARALNLSLRSMQRKLKEEGTSYREVLDATRRRLAELYAKDATLSSAEIAYLLGFAEPTSYSRALRRWRAQGP